MLQTKIEPSGLARIAGSSVRLPIVDAVSSVIIIQPNRCVGMKCDRANTDNPSPITPQL